LVTAIGPSNMADNSKALFSTRTPALNAQPTKVKASRQGVICMWHGLGLPGWLKILGHKPDFTPSYAFRWASISALSLLTSAQNLLESAVYGRKVARTQIEYPPIFVLGHWRSGTTLLHNLMTLDPEMTYANLYHCMCPGNFLLTESVVPRLTKYFIPKTRPMDNMAITWHTPQEDEIALAVDCGISPYLMLAFPMRRDIYGRYFDPRDMTPEERTTWKASLLRLIQKLTVRKNRPVVLKSPSHTYRVATLLKMFPNAKFVYIYRDPYAVYSSSMHLRKTMFAENSLFPQNLEGNEDEMFLNYETCIRTYEETKSLIPAGNLHELRFEDLEVDPLGEVAQTYKALGLTSWASVEPLIKQELPKLTAYKKNSFRMDKELMQKVYGRLKWVFDRYGYSSRLEETEVPIS
jgi:omega-hydroxy-beta-dihydromenaquinone-9 sulfotransferase